MATRYKVISKTRPKHLLGHYEVPDEALNLNESILMLEQVLTLLKKIEPYHITKDSEFGWQMLQSQMTLVKSWLRYARRKLATEYLAP